MDPIFERNPVKQVVVVEIAHSVDRDVAASNARALGIDFDRSERAASSQCHSRRQQLELKEIAPV